MKKKAKVHYNRDRVVSGGGPHKLIKLNMQIYLKKKEAEKNAEKDVFDIDANQ